MNEHRQHRDQKVVLLTIARLSTIFHKKRWAGHEKLDLMAKELALGEDNAIRFANRISTDVPFA